MSNVPPPPPPPGGLHHGTGGPPSTDGQAVAALVCGIVGVLCVVPAIAAIVLGVTSKNRIDQSNGQLTGRGMATAGMVLGIALVTLTVVVVMVRVSRS